MGEAADKVETRVALVTGAAPGFGQVLCATLAEAGYHVAGIARSRRAEKGIAAAVSAAGGVYLHHTCDVSDATNVQETINAIESGTGPVEVLVHNAHRLLINPFAETGTDDFEAVWRTGCLGAMHAARAVLPGMLRRKKGTIIFTGATASKRAGARFAAFASAKFAQRGLAQSLAREFGPQGIHVVHTIIDGLIWEPQTIERFDPDEANCLSAQSLADTYLQLINQDKSAWTHEIDLRPSSETF